MTAYDIKQKALELGYLACGIIPANIFEEYTRYLDERVKTFPESKALYESLYALAHQPDAAKSIVVCTRGYTKYKTPDSLNGLYGKVYMFDGRLPYAHENRMKSEFESYLSICGVNILQCGVPDRWAAAKAGLGKFGRNNFIYDKTHGSYIWIHTWTTDKELEYDVIEENVMAEACGDIGCEKCVGACPTKALSGSLSMNRGKCITHLQCDLNSIPDEETMSGMGLWLYGCDECQDACPMNRNKFTEREAFPLLAEVEEYLQPERILEMDEATYADIVNPRFWYLGKDGAWLWKCNALRSMINDGGSKYHPFIRACRDCADDRIRKTARWGCEKLGI